MSTEAEFLFFLTTLVTSVAGGTLARIIAENAGIQDERAKGVQFLTSVTIGSGLWALNIIVMKTASMLSKKSK